MTQRRSRRFGRPAAVPTFTELAEADGADVTDLLREVSEFRLALDTDLTIAAAAAEVAAEESAPVELSEELTAQAVDAGRTALDELVTRRLRGGSGAARRARATRRPRGGARPAGRRSRRVPIVGAGPLVGVAIVLGLGTGLFASHLGGQTKNQGLSKAASVGLHSLSSALGQGNDQAAREASNQLSAAIGSLIAAAPDDPAAAQAAASALSAEQTLLASTSGTLGEQLRASMAAQVVALQSTVRTPLTALVTPSKGAASLRVPLPLPSKLVPSALSSLVVLPSIPMHVTASHRVSPTHVPDAVSSVLGLVVPSAKSSAPAVTASKAATPSPTPTAASPTATPTASPSATAAPTTGPSDPFPFATPGTDGFGLPH